jgi:hypothetical protein
MSIFIGPGVSVLACCGHLYLYRVICKTPIVAPSYLDLATQFFASAYMGRVFERVFIGVSVHMCCGRLRLYYVRLYLGGLLITNPLQLLENFCTIARIHLSLPLEELGDVEFWLLQRS